MMTFEEAIQCIQNGKKIKRSIFENNHYIQGALIKTITSKGIKNISENIDPFLIFNNGLSMGFYNPSSEDINADDWEVIE